MKEEKTGSSRCDVDFHLFLALVLCLRPTPGAGVFVPKRAACRTNVAPLFVCLFVCLHLMEACVHMSEGPSTLQSVLKTKIDEEEEMQGKGGGRR